MNETAQNSLEIPEADVSLINRFLQVFCDKQKALQDKYPSPNAIGDEYASSGNQEALLSGLVEIQSETLRQIHELGLLSDIFKEVDFDLAGNLPKPEDAAWSYALVETREIQQKSVLDRIIALTGFKFRTSDVPVGVDRRGNQSA